MLLMLNFLLKRSPENRGDFVGIVALEPTQRFCASVAPGENVLDAGSTALFDGDGEVVLATGFNLVSLDPHLYGLAVS